MKTPGLPIGSGSKGVTGPHEIRWARPTRSEVDRIFIDTPTVQGAEGKLVGWRLSGDILEARIGDCEGGRGGRIR